MKQHHAEGITVREPNATAPRTRAEETSHDITVMSQGVLCYCGGGARPNAHLLLSSVLHHCCHSYCSSVTHRMTPDTLCRVAVGSSTSRAGPGATGQLGGGLTEHLAAAVGPGSGGPTGPVLGQALMAFLVSG